MILSFSRFSWTNSGFHNESPRVLDTEIFIINNRNKKTNISSEKNGQVDLNQVPFLYICIPIIESRYRLEDAQTDSQPNMKLNSY